MHQNLRSTCQNNKGSFS